MPIVNVYRQIVRRDLARITDTHYPKKTMTAGIEHGGDLRGPDREEQNERSHKAVVLSTTAFGPRRDRGPGSKRGPLPSNGLDSGVVDARPLGRVGGS